MKYANNLFSLFDNYLIARWFNRPSTALFWYLPEPINIATKNDLMIYKDAKHVPCYLINYQKKLDYKLENEDGIIVLPYKEPIGKQVNPEAAFQYALGLHDHFCLTNDTVSHDKFWRYVNYFVSRQNKDGCWGYHFNWFGSNAPWYSALAQGRGASVMLRAYMHSDNLLYLNAAKNALQKFTLSITEGGFMHLFAAENCAYFEEYPQTPTGVLNGFMASLLSIWELAFWSQEKWLNDLWSQGIQSLEKMLPHYSTGWWSLYDLDPGTPIVNVNSPRYHLLEINYLKILSLLSDSSAIKSALNHRIQQYQNIFYRQRALLLKLIRKVIYK